MKYVGLTKIASIKLFRILSDIRVSSGPFGKSEQTNAEGSNQMSLNQSDQDFKENIHECSY